MSKSNPSWLAVALSAVLVLSGCAGSGAPAPSLTPQPMVSTGTPPALETQPATTEPLPTPAIEQPGTSTGSPADPAGAPVPKVVRGGQPAEPAVSADPADTTEEVRYPDGVRLAITDVAFRVEEGKGPGVFQGRELALLSLEIQNGGGEAISLDTVVVTVLDAAGEPAPPMSAPEGDVRDFAGDVRPGDTAQARYAFAVPTQARSQVTVVVDFDGRHASAVFRGSLD